MNELLDRINKTHFMDFRNVPPTRDVTEVEGENYGQDNSGNYNHQPKGQPDQYNSACKRVEKLHKAILPTIKGVTMGSTTHVTATPFDHPKLGKCLLKTYHNAEGNPIRHAVRDLSSGTEYQGADMQSAVEATL